MSFKKKIFNFLTALVVVFGSAPLSFVRNAYAAEGDLPAPATNKQLIDNGDGTYTIALSVTGETDTSSSTTVSKANVILVLDTSSSMNQNAGNTYYLVTSGTPGNPANEGNSHTTYYRKDGNTYRELYYNDGVWYTTRTQGQRPGTYTYSGVYSGDFYARSRLWAEKHALIDTNGIIDNLLAQNVPGDTNKNDIIEVALVNFGQKGITQQGFTTNGSVLKNKITSLTTDSGTNWEEALIRADELADSIRTTQPNEDIYVLFLTDGQPSTANNDYTVSNGANGNTGWIARWGAASDNARDLVVDGNTFYGLFTWGDSNYEGYLKALVQYAYTGVGAYNTSLSSDYSGYYTNASSTETLIAALKQIVNDITTGVGYTNVGLTDGITSMTDSSVKTSTNGEVRGLRYYRSGGSYSTTANGGLGEEWTDAPKATINDNGEVDWQLGSLVLENGVTYTVAFVVWPKQTSLDLVADLNNGIVKYDELSDKEKAQIAGSNGSYTLKTNTDYPTVTYSTITTTTVNGQTTTVVSDPVTANITNPDPVGLYSGSLSVEKKWEDGLDPQQQEDFNGVVTLNLYKDGDDDDRIVNTYVLEKANGWKSDTPYAISPGVMVYSTSKAVQDEEYTAIRYDGDGKDYVILEEGHDYHYDEPAITGHYYLTKHVYHPMVVNGVVKNVLFEYDDSGEIITGIEEIESLNTLSATNTLKGGISLFKEVYDDGEKIENLDEKFTVKLSFEDSSYGYTYRIYYGSNNPCSKDGANETTCNFDPNNHGRTNKMSGTGVLEHDIYVGDEIMIIDVETGTKFKVEEITDGMKSWYEFSEVQHDISRNAKNQYGAYKSSEIDGDYRTVQANSSSRAIVKNNYITGDLKVSKTVNVESGNEAKANSKEFEFTVDVYTNNDKTEKLNDYSTTIKLKNGESQSITDIPAGTYYEVAETRASGFTTTSTGDNGTITKDNTSEADFVNTYKVTPTNAQARVAKMFGDFWDLTKINGFEFELTPKTTTTGSFPEITATNNTATQLTPANWTFKIVDEGTWTYEITEKAYDHPGVFPLTENEKVTLIVKAIDNGDGTMTIQKTYSKNATNVDEDSATIDNTYKTQNTVSETIGVTKTVIDEVTGNHNDKFTFELKDAKGDVVDTVSFTTVNLSGDGSFKTLTFDKAGTYRYTISEKTTEKGGWTYDETSHEVVIVVTEDYTTATLSSEMTIDGKKVNTVGFTNEYTVEQTTATVTVTKDFKDFWYEGDSFTFTLESKDGSVKQIKTVNELNKTATFTLSYDMPGDFEYTVTEDTQFARPGISRVTTEPITVKVSVVDNNDGTLTATVTQGKAGTIENKYETSPTNATIKVKKTIDDISNSKKDGRFTFDLKKADGSVKETITISTRQLSGDGNFETLEFNKEGVYKYTVTERNGGVAGFTYDTTPKSIEIVVSDNKEDAALYVSSIKLDGEEISVDETGVIELEIENAYEAKKASIELSANKAIDGRDWLDSDKFTFVLSGDGIDNQTKTATSSAKTVKFDKIYFAQVGTYHYKIAETGEMPGGIQKVTDDIDVTVTVEDDGNGKLVATAEYSVEDQTIVNKYTTKSTTATVKATKEFQDFWYEGDSFTFTLANEDESTKIIKTVDQLNPTATFTLEYDTPGDYEYTITEDTQFVRPGISLVTTEPITVKVSVVDNNDGTLTATVTQGEAGTIENTYEAKPSSAVLKVKKTINDLTNSKKDGNFTFDLKKANGSVQDTVTISTSNLSGEGSFKAIKFTKEGTYKYTISERKGNTPGFSYDTTARSVEIVVKDNKETAELYVDSITIDGVRTDTVEIENDYEAKKTSIELSATKSITGRKWLDTDEFEFTLSDDSAYSQTKTATKNAKTVTFDAIEYTKVGTHSYTISETSELPAGMKNKTGDITVTVTVEDDGKGALKATAEYSVKNQTVVNEYKTASTFAVLNVEKTINDLSNSKKDGDFTFDLKDSDDETIDTVVVSTQNLNGSGSFKAIDYTKAGTYTYTIVEQDGGVAGFSYDTKARKVEIVVKDNPEEAKLYVDSITIDGENTDIVKIENDYEAKKTSIKLSATKAIEGRDWLDSDKFTFELVGDNTKTQTKTATKSAPTVTFNKIEYTKVGTYNYTISETGKLPAGMENKTGDITVTVDVKDDGEGALKATAKYSVEDRTIVNAYSTEPTSVKFNIKKTIKDLSNSKKDAKFRFAFNEAQFEIATTDLKGELNNDIELAFNKEQTLEFEVFEINDRQAGFTYDNKTYKVKVTVTDDYEKAKLNAVITVDGKKISGDEYVFEFTNQYQATATETQFGIQKIIDILNGEIKADEDFKFELADAKNKVLETVTITGEGEAVFAPIKFKKVGAHKYTISEIIGSAKYYEYDPTIYEVVVNVIDNNGQLMIESTSTKILGSDDDVEVIVFTNTYDKAPEEPKTPDTGRFTADSNDAVSEISSSIIAGMVILFGILLGLIKNKNWRGLIRARINAIIARNE